MSRGSTELRQRITSGMGWTALALVLVVMMLRCLVRFRYQIYFDSATVGLGEGDAAMGPRGIAITDLGCVLALVLAIGHAWLSGQRVMWWAVLIWVAGFGFAMNHGLSDYESLILGADWAAWIALSLAVMHLCQVEVWRRLMMCALVGLLVAVGVDALYQFSLHGETIALHEQEKEAFLKARGWTESSPGYVKFRERLDQREVVGSVGLSNVMATVMMVLTLISAGIAEGLLRRNKRCGIAWGLMLIVCFGLLIMGMTYSKGGWVAMMVACGAIGGWWWIRSLWKGRAPSWGAIGVVIVSAGVFGVMARGLAGAPETAEGERSMLFRWHYWQGAMHGLQEDPIAGIGPGRFPEVYRATKPEISPEDVTDPHNIFVFFVSTLGLGGSLWTGLILMMVYLSGRMILYGCGKEDRDEADEESIDAQPVVGGYRRLIFALLVTTPVFLTVYLMAFGAMSGDGVTSEVDSGGISGGTFGGGGAVVGLVLICVLLVGLGLHIRRNGLGRKSDEDASRTLSVRDRMISNVLLVLGVALPAVISMGLGAWWVGWLAVIGAIAYLPRMVQLNDGRMVLGLFVAAVAMVLHSQIEMSMSNVMSAPLLFATLGLAAGVGLSRVRSTVDHADEKTDPYRDDIMNVTSLLLTVIVLIMMVVWQTVPVFAHQNRLERAESAIRVVDKQDARTRITGGQLRAALAELGRASDVMPSDLMIATYMAQVYHRGALAHYRLAQAELAAGRKDAAREQRDEAEVAIIRGVGVLVSVRQQSTLRRGALLKADIGLRRAGARYVGRRRWAEGAVEVAEQLLETNPKQLTSLRLAIDVALGAGNYDKANAWFDRLKKLNAMHYLDPQGTISESEMNLIAKRIQTIKSPKKTVSEPKSDKSTNGEGSKRSAPEPSP